MRLQPFEYVILLHSKKDEEDTIVLQDTTKVMCVDAAQVRILASRVIPEKYLNRLDDVEIHIRQFISHYRDRL